MKQRGITNVIILGVHTNMCVLGRPFSIRQMVYQGQNVALVRDLTDTMYNPRSKPFVPHTRGTELVVEHIERHWCPTLTSTDILGGETFQFSDVKIEKDFRKPPTSSATRRQDGYRIESCWQMKHSYSQQSQPWCWWGVGNVWLV